MIKREIFFTEESANRKINQLRDEGKRFVIDEFVDYVFVDYVFVDYDFVDYDFVDYETCEDIPIAYTQITWEE